MATTRSETSPAGAIDSGGVNSSSGIVLPPHARPDVAERALDLGDRRPANLDAGIAPGVDPARGIAEPLRARAEPADEADAPVYRDALAVIARQPADRAVEPRRIEHAHRASRFDQGREERAPRARAEPVVEEPHPDAGARPLGKRLHELAADRVVADDVALEVDGTLGRPDRVEPGREILGRVLEDPNVVARRSAAAPAARLNAWSASWCSPCGAIAGGRGRSDSIHRRRNLAHGGRRLPHAIFPTLQRGAREACARARAKGISTSERSE